LEPIFHPRSIALAGITLANPEHWTRTFLESLIAIGFPGTIYLVNPKGGEIDGLRVYRRLEDIPDTVDYAISTVPAREALGLMKACADKGVKAVHFCTAGFKETGEEEGVRLEAELAELSRITRIRIIGPNCMGVYCPESRLSFNSSFPKESGPVGLICQSGGNATNLVNQAAWRGVRFSKVISYGNACDLEESDFLEYFATDPDTKVVALYVEGVKNGGRFRRALRRVASEKVVILLKGGITEGGARTVAGHTGALAGSEVVWNSLCKQLGVIRVYTMEEMADILVTLLFMPLPKGRRSALVGAGGGASVLISDEFEKRGLVVPPLPREVRNRIREFTPLTGNILQNPIDYSQGVREFDKSVRTVGIIAQWEGIDFLVGFLRPGVAPPGSNSMLFDVLNPILEVRKTCSKPMAIVLEPSILPEEAEAIFAVIQKCVSLGLPVYYSFAAAANSISLLLSYNQRGTRRVAWRF